MPPSTALSEARLRWHHHARRSWIDLPLAVAVAGALFGFVDLAGEAVGPHRALADIDLRLAALPKYTFFSLSRGLIAYLLSLSFTIAYAYWAAKDAAAEQVLIPLLDVLQSIPVLSFMPGLLIAMVALFPNSNFGLELAVILSIFTGQAWNMVFSLYHSLRSIPADRLEVAALFRFSTWQRAKWVELPSAAIGLVWNSMMSMAGGWVFLTIIESFKLRNQDYRLPGLGSYLNEAWKQENYGAMSAGFAAMIAMIVGLDQLLWRPIVVWAQKFRTDEDAAPPGVSSWFLTALRRSRLIRWIHIRWRRRAYKSTKPRVAAAKSVASRQWPRFISSLALVALAIGLLVGAWGLLQLLARVTGSEWRAVFEAAGWTFARVAAATALGTLWALPAGLAIGLSPRIARWAQPVVQVIASFPAPIIFPIVVAGMIASGITLGWGSVVLIMLGTQWYILFNVISGAMALPADLREAARAYRWPPALRLRRLYLPGVFPYLVTGWVTAAGGAWNLSIVAEYVTLRDERVEQARGLGAMISRGFDRGPDGYAVLAASTLVLAGMVVLVNRTVWRACYRLAESRYSLSR
jgi:NitT/TauT family transport system permease protein